MDTDFVRERITQLRLQKGVSEYQMSYDLGCSRGYIYNISSGKSLPPIPKFLEICDYLGVTPSQFLMSLPMYLSLCRKLLRNWSNWMMMI